MTGRRDFLRQTSGLLLLGGLGSAAGIGCSGGGTPAPPLLIPPTLPDVPPAPTPASPTAGQEWTNPKDGSVLIWVPGGTFQMGTNEELIGNAFEGKGSQPIHTVTLSGFWMGKYEVTIGQFNRYAAEVGLTNHPLKDFYISEGYKDNYPVGGNWVLAMDYANWAGLTLPTEAQWEYAATGGDGRRYPWGNEWDPTRCRSDASAENRRPAEVGSFPAGVSPFGMYDMAGNAWEWCRDWRARYPSEPQTDPVVTQISPSKMMRGGGHGSLPHQCHCAYRAINEIYSGSASIGFRLASR